MSVIDTELLEHVRTELAIRAQPPTALAVAQVLRDGNRLVGDNSVLTIVERLRRDAGLGVLEPLLAIPGVTDVLVNGADRIYFDRGSGLERADVVFQSEKEVRRFAQRLATQAGRRLDDASPFVDARLPGGIRMHAILSPVARPGTAISLRVMGRHSLSVDELRDRGSIDDVMAQILRSLISTRRAFVISGGTGAGKTTILAALLSEIPSHERIVIVEDSAELRPQHPHVVSMESRSVNIEGAGMISMRDLVRQALRMRPDRLVIGEVRGGEIVELLAALNTGHEGGCGTIHANSAGDVPARIEALGITAGLNREAVHAQLASAVDVIVHVDRQGDSIRHVREIALTQVKNDRVQVLSAASFQPGKGTIIHPQAEDQMRDLGLW